MFERYTEQAKRAILAAENEARALQHAHVGTEHLLLGLLDEPGVATAALDRLGIALEAVRQQVLGYIYPGDVPVAAPRAPREEAAAAAGRPEIVPFTPRAMVAAELALREALRFGHSYIGTEHVLLGLIRERDGVAAMALADLSGDLARVRQAVIQELHRGEAEKHMRNAERSRDDTRDRSAIPGAG
jgi:ATP-dependent Clp protease ATP-binding subunit ClpC